MYKQESNVLRVKEKILENSIEFFLNPKDNKLLQIQNTQKPNKNRLKQWSQGKFTI